jgi:hypothetical protein
LRHQPSDAVGVFPHDHRGVGERDQLIVPLGFGVPAVLRVVEGTATRGRLWDVA